MNTNNLRITKLKEYLLEIVKSIKGNNSKINVDILSKDVNNYSLDKIPTDNIVEKWVNGTTIYKDVYSFRNRQLYSADEINNLKNIGFFEEFEAIIKDNNRKGELPSIKGIQSIECLNCGTLVEANVGTAVFDIQIQIKYKEEL